MSAGHSGRELQIVLEKSSSKFRFFSWFQSRLAETNLEKKKQYLATASLYLSHLWTIEK